MNEIDWLSSKTLVEYAVAIEFMEKKIADIYEQKCNDLIWFLEHPPIYTAGTSALPEELLEPDKFPIFQTGRGGKFTYHGPGQLVTYVMLNLKRNPHTADVKKFVFKLEQVVINTLLEFNISAFRREGRIGIWVVQDGSEAKIAAIGIRIRKWVTYHGIALNINPNLEHFKGIIACGIDNYGVTSLERLGMNYSISEVIDVLKRKFKEEFCFL